MRGSPINLWCIQGLALIQNGLLRWDPHWTEPEEGVPANMTHGSRLPSHPLWFHIDSKRLDKRV